MLNSVEEALSRHQRMDARELTVPLEKFARRLMDLGYTSLTICGLSKRSASFRGVAVPDWYMSGSDRRWHRCQVRTSLVPMP
jgi:hypothetical protein